MNRLYFGDNLKWLSDRKEFPDASADQFNCDRIVKLPPDLDGLRDVSPASHERTAGNVVCLGSECVSRVGFGVAPKRTFS